MKLEQVKRNLNQVVLFVDPRRPEEATSYQLAGCMLRKNETGYYYEVELYDLKAKSSRLITRLEDIREVENETRL